MSERREPVVANLLTGFLGAGKTSLLNRLLSKPSLSDTAVLINEFGMVALDHLLVQSVNDNIVLLKSGCICCSIRTDLKDAILSLFDRLRRGKVRPFGRIVIETTGLADPVPILATLSVDPMLKYHFRIGNIIAVVDVPNGAHNIETYPEIRPSGRSGRPDHYQQKRSCQPRGSRQAEGCVDAHKSSRGSRPARRSHRSG